MRNLAQFKNGKRIDHYETIRMTKDGRKIPISLTISPIKHGHGNIIGASKVARDICIQVKAQEEIIIFSEAGIDFIIIKKLLR